MSMKQENVYGQQDGSCNYRADQKVSECNNPEKQNNAEACAGRLKIFAGRFSKDYKQDKAYEKPAGEIARGNAVIPASIAPDPITEGP